MDLTHLFKSSRDVIQTRSRTQQEQEDSAGCDREVMFKRKGFNFSSTSDNRIIRSSQETDRRKSSRHLEHWKSRIIPRKDKANNSKICSKPVSDKENVRPINPETESQDSSLEEKGSLNDVASCKAAAMQQSRRDKLKEFITRRHILEEEKRKKLKPVFRAGGVVQHPYSAFGGSEASSALHNHSKLSRSTSNLSSLFSNSSFKKPQPRFSRSTSLSNFRSNRNSNQDGGKILNVIEEDLKDVKPEDVSTKEQSSFAPQNFKFKMEMKVEDPGEGKSMEISDKSQAIGNLVLSEALLVPEVKPLDNDLIEEAEGIDDKYNEKEEIVSTDDNVETGSEDPSLKSNEDDILKVKPFRNLLETETARLTTLCDIWEAKILNIPEDQDFEDIRGEVRSVVGQGRLVMAERFHQFSGLVDNCQFKRGEKETTVEDLRGFWEMIFIQVEDVDKKFSGLVAIEENSWKALKVRQTNVPKSRNTGKTTTKSLSKSKQASSGLKALIAARRKAAKTDQVPEVTVEEVESTPSKPGRSEGKEPLSNGGDGSGKTFDGGFFTVKSPMCEKKSPRSCRSSSNKIRQAAFTNSAKKVNSLLLSPFISAVAKMSLTASPLTDTSSSPAKAPKPMVLFEADEDDDESGGEVTLEGSPKIDERYFMPSAVTITTPASCVDLISFESPRLVMEQ